VWQLAPSPAHDGRDSTDRHKRSDAAVREGRARARHVARRKKIQLRKRDTSITSCFLAIGPTL
jgi:hypothetical protein